MSCRCWCRCFSGWNRRRLLICKSVYFDATFKTSWNCWSGETGFSDFGCSDDVGCSVRPTSCWVHSGRIQWLPVLWMKRLVGFTDQTWCCWWKGDRLNLQWLNLHRLNLISMIWIIRSSLLQERKTFDYLFILWLVWGGEARSLLDGSVTEPPEPPDVSSSCFFRQKGGERKQHLTFHLSASHVFISAGFPGSVSAATCLLSLGHGGRSGRRQEKDFRFVLCSQQLNVSQQFWLSHCVIVNRLNVKQRCENHWRKKIVQ